jgi:hypothetical protein
MDRKGAIHSLLRVIVFELLQFIRESESSFKDRWVPAADIKNALELNFVAVPRENKQYGEKGWFFAILARMLEDDGLVEYKKEGSRSYYRSSRP